MESEKKKLERTSGRISNKVCLKTVHWTLMCMLSYILQIIKMKRSKMKSGTRERTGREGRCKQKDVISEAMSLRSFREQINFNCFYIKVIFPYWKLLWILALVMMTEVVMAAGDTEGLGPEVATWQQDRATERTELVVMTLTLTATGELSPF